MGRRGWGKFEVKNEMRDGKKVKHEETNKKFHLSEEDKKRIMEEANRVGGFDDFEIDDDVAEEDADQNIDNDAQREDVDQNRDNDVQEDIDKWRLTKKASMEQELEEYYSFDVGDEYTIAYLKENLAPIYDEELSARGVASVSEMVDSYFEYNEFVGVESYRELVGNIDTVINIMRDNERKAQKNNEEKQQIDNDEKISLSEKEKTRIMAGCKNYGNSSELSLSLYIASEARKLGVEKQMLTQYLREEQKSKIECPEKVLHYHRTSLDSAMRIIESGYFLNRAGIQQRGGDISKFNGSSSSNVQFSVDVYNHNGEMISSGYNPQDNLGASSTDVVFVMGRELINEESYDCFGAYPTVEQADVSRSCVTILAKDEKTKKEIEKKLEEKGIVVDVILQEEFDRDSTISKTNNVSSDDKFEEDVVPVKETATKEENFKLQDQTTEREVETTGFFWERDGHRLSSEPKKNVDREETGLILKSVNGKDILEDAVRATEKDVTVSDIKTQQNNIVEVEKQNNLARQNSASENNVLSSAVAATENSVTASMISTQANKIVEAQQQSVQISVSRKMF